MRLPEGRTLRDLSYIAVWCKKVAANFGHLELKSSKSATIPTAIEIRPLSQLEHGVKSGPINIIDAQTFLITDFAYDGKVLIPNYFFFQSNYSVDLIKNNLLNRGRTSRASNLLLFTYEY